MFITHMFVFFGYSAFTLYLLATGEIERFLSPRLEWLAYFSGFSLGLFLLVLSMREADKHKGKIWKEAAKGILLVYPVILFFIVKPSDISSVNIPAVKVIPAKRPVIKKPAPPSLPVDDTGYVRLNLFELWLLSRNFPDLAQRYKVKTVGTVSNISEKYITLSRLFMTCCAADATPVEVDVTMPSSNDNLKGFIKGDWLEVTGTVIIRDYVIVIPDSVRPVKDKFGTYITRWSEEPPFNPD